MNENIEYKKIFIFEPANTFNVSKSLLFLIFIINHILVKIIKGSSFIIILGINMLVNRIGTIKFTFVFLKIQFPQAN